MLNDKNKKEEAKELRLSEEELAKFRKESFRMDVDIYIGDFIDTNAEVQESIKKAFKRADINKQCMIVNYLQNINAIYLKDELKEILSESFDDETELNKAIKDNENTSEATELIKSLVKNTFDEYKLNNQVPFYGGLDYIENNGSFTVGVCTFVAPMNNLKKIYEDLCNDGEIIDNEVDFEDLVSAEDTKENTHVDYTIGDPYEMAGGSTATTNNLASAESDLEDTIKCSYKFSDGRTLEEVAVSLDKEGDKTKDKLLFFFSGEKEPVEILTPKTIKYFGDLDIIHGKDKWKERAAGYFEDYYTRLLKGEDLSNLFHEIEATEKAIKKAEETAKEAKKLEEQQAAKTEEATSEEDTTNDSAKELKDSTMDGLKFRFKDGMVIEALETEGSDFETIKDEAIKVHKQLLVSQKEMCGKTPDLDIKNKTPEFKYMYKVVVGGKEIGCFDSLDEAKEAEAKALEKQDKAAEGIPTPNLKDEAETEEVKVEDKPAEEPKEEEEKTVEISIEKIEDFDEMKDYADKGAWMCTKNQALFDTLKDANKAIYFVQIGDLNYMFLENKAGFFTAYSADNKIDNKLWDDKELVEVLLPALKVESKKVEYKKI